jgi:putative phosphoribosyl transferase
VPVKDRTVIVVDDGIATGATMRASLKALHARDPAKIVLAVPVAAAETLRDLRGAVDDIVCLLVPRPLYGVGAHYAEFGQTSDDEVIRLMAEADRVAEGRRNGRQ